MADPDPLGHIRVSDPDPLPDFRVHHRVLCTETTGVSLGNVCMREHGHPGQHIDNNGGEVIATWPQRQR